MPSGKVKLLGRKKPTVVKFNSKKKPVKRFVKRFSSKIPKKKSQEVIWKPKVFSFSVKAKLLVWSPCRKQRTNPSPASEESMEKAGDNDAMEDVTFTKGALVEFCSDEEGFHGSWFTATVVKSAEKDKFLIEYKSLRMEDDSAFLREEVDSMHTRPYPPKFVVDCYKKLDEVDAFYNDGWWVGVVSKVLKEGSRYIVYFRETCEELEYGHSELRLHQDWIDGKWVIPSRALQI